MDPEFRFFWAQVVYACWGESRASLERCSEVDWMAGQYAGCYGLWRQGMHRRN